MKSVTYRVTLLEPVLVTSLEGDPNSAVAHDYLPGSVLRGALIGLTMHKEGIKEFDATNNDIRRLFFDGQTRFLNGYLVIDGKRSLPAPRSWEQDKHAQGGEEKRITDRALTPSPTLEEQHGQVKGAKEPGKPKSLSGKFCVLIDDGNAAYIVEPQHVINVHTERDRIRGRSLGAGRGTIYRYDALAAGQVFEAMILCNEDVDADYFAELLGTYSATTLGGARSAGYGRVALSDVQIRNVQREVGGNILSKPDELIVTLLSDVILRNSHGQFSPDIDTLCAALAARLEVDATQLEVDRAFKNEGIVGGFNRKWGLPLPQMLTLTMGSTFVLNLTNLSEEQTQALPDKLGWLEWLGIGERRAEGFGRVTVNWQQHPTLEVREWKLSAGFQTEILLSDESKQLWDAIQARIMQQQVDQKQLEAANAIKLNPKRLPPKSQINRLRQIVTSELLKDEPKTSAIAQFLKDIEGKKAEEHFRSARVDNQSMTDWLMAQAKTQDHYAALRLVDAVLARAAKVKKQEERQVEVEHD
ncbi:MAG: CRISPR-associated RAMP protein Csx10 [Anaerolineae bacterium]